MSERSPSRRSLLKGATAALLTVPATITALEADPLRALVAAYRDECARLNAIPGDIPDDEPTPVWEALNEGPLPVAATKEGAMDALRLAIEMHKDFTYTKAVPNLMQAALGFLEGGIS
ncbi:hypothetical protein Xaut_3425 [Xanthobacter versatilis]|uniref:Uncharacterized protein n=1 Tax=Xanthobacter autotrophicus (strain ATCC BAA-1158 / Py2) TaxID=78245 RepID=A7IKW1_XANP2|nr:hypothetical protein Xaut_3425 [Xanthobacter autotrophicus Py2]